MNHITRHFTLTAGVLAASLLVAACGGGEATGPADTTPPTVTVTDSEAGSNATGPVTFTFKFSEDVGTSFTAEDIVVTGGTAGAFTRVSGTEATLVVTPVAGATGKIVVSVAAQKFSDAAANGNTAAASAEQAYAPAVTSTALVTFDETPAPTVHEFGGALSTVEAGPAGGTGLAFKITRPGGEVWAGGWVATPTMPFAANRKTVTARVYSPTAGVQMVAKAEYAENTGTGETTPTTAVVAGWQTLTWVFNNVDITKTYNRFVILPNLGTVGTGQAYYVDDITVAPEGPAVVEPPAGVDTVLATFDEATPPLIFEFGGAGYAIEAGPAGGNANALKITRPGGEVYAGAYVATAAIPFSATRKTITARVYSPTAGVPMVVKAEYAENAGTGDTTPTTAVVAGWQTLTWVFNSVDLSKTYTRFVILPNLGTVGSGQSYHFDDIKLLAGAAGGGGGTATKLTFSSGFGANQRTVEGGGFYGFAGSSFDGYYCDPANPANCGSGGAYVPAVAAADSAFYFYVQTSSPAVGLYDGVGIYAPGVTALSATADTAGIQITNQTTMTFNLAQNPEWFASATKNFMVNLDLGKLYLVGVNACHLQLRKIITPTSAAATSYTVTLSSFSVVQDCAKGIAPDAVAAALAASPISQVTFQGAGGASAVPQGGLTTGANLSVPVGSPAVYPTTVSVKGAVTFQ